MTSLIVSYDPDAYMPKADLADLPPKPLRSVALLWIRVQSEPSDAQLREHFTVIMFAGASIKIL